MTDREILKANECVVPWYEPEQVEFCAGVRFMEKRK